jgi:hypothetical protein
MGKADLLSSFSSEWIKYDNYEYREDNGGNLYICPTKGAKISFYKAFDVRGEMLPDILNIGRMIKDEKALETGRKSLMDMVLVFVRKYGLLVLMNYFPFNERFLNQNKVLLPEGNMISQKELLSAKEYVQKFIPFATPDTFEIRSGNNGAVAINHKDEIPVTLFIEKPLPFEIMFSRHYCEKFDWIATYAGEIYDYFSLINAFYKDRPYADAQKFRDVCKSLIDTFSAQGMSFNLKLHEKAKIEWDFNSLRAAIDTIFGFMIGSGEDCPVKVCKHDGVIFYAKNPKAEFCSPQCRNQFNVYKSRGKKE